MTKEKLTKYEYSLRLATILFTIVNLTLIYYSIFFLPITNIDQRSDWVQRFYHFQVTLIFQWAIVTVAWINFLDSLLKKDI